MATARQLVIADIHGCSKTFFKLLESINLTPQDQLFLLGDYINKGRDSAGVLDILLDLIRKGYRLFPLRGNHEQRLLQRHQNKEATATENLNLPIVGKAKGLVDVYKKILPKYYHFLAELPYYYELRDFFLVHAGFNKESNDPFLDYESMLWIRDFEVNAAQRELVFKNKIVVFGHNPTALETIISDIKYRKNAICLDNGCVFKSNPLMGNLVCLDLNSFGYTIQENID